MARDYFSNAAKRFAGTTLLTAGVGYLALLAFLRRSQRILIFPGTINQGAKATKVIVPDSMGGTLIQLETASHVPVTGYYTGHDIQVHATGKTVLFFYGNGSCINSCLYIVEHFRLLGCSVMIIDYPGYGMSGGAATDSGCYEAAESAYQYLTQGKAVPESELIVAGWSLGSAVAIHLTAQHQVAGLVTFSAFTTMSAMASQEYPIVPKPIVDLLLKYPFPSAQKISQVHCPIFMAHGALDKRISPAMSKALANAAGGPVTEYLVPHVGHNDILLEGGLMLYGNLEKWINSLPS